MSREPPPGAVATPNPGPVAPPPPVVQAPPTRGPDAIALRGGVTKAREVKTIGPEAERAVFETAPKLREEGIAAQAGGHIAALGQQYDAAKEAYDTAETKAFNAHVAVLNNQERAQAAQQKVADLAQQTANAGDFQDYWSDKTTGQRALSMIAVALTTFGQTLAGGDPNMGLNALKGMMDHDLRIKELNYKKKLDTQNVAQQQYNNLVQQVGLDSASDIYAGAMRDKAAAQLRMDAAKSGIPEIQGNAIKAADDIKADASERYGSAALKFQPAAAAPTQYLVRGPNGDMIPIPVSAGKAFETLEKGQQLKAEQGGRVDLKAMEGEQKREETSAKRAEDDRSLIVTLPSGEKRKARDKAEAVDLGKQIASVEDVKQQVRRGLKLRSELASFDTIKHPLEAAAKRKELQGLQGDFLASVKPIFGVLSDGERGTAQDMSGRLMDFTPGTDAQLEAFANNFGHSLGHRLATLPESGGSGSVKVAEHPY